MKHDERPGVFPSAERLRTMGLRPFSLTFEGAIERAYRRDAFRKSLPQLRLAIVLGLLLYGVFGLLDAALVPELKARFWVLRYGVATPAAVAVLFFSYSPRFEDAQQFCMIGLMTLGGLLIIAMIVMAPPPVTYSYYAGVILVLIWGYTFARARFLWACVGGWLLVGVYEIAALGLTRAPSAVLINNNFFFISANILGMFACYSIDYFDRRDFFLSRQIREEQAKVLAANEALERQVSLRTRELEEANGDLRREIEEHAHAQNEKRRLEERLARSEKMEALGRLAGGVAHDLNNILGAVVGYPDLILEKMSPDDPQRRRVMTIQRSGQKAAAIVQDLLTMARRGVPTKDVLNLNDIISDYLVSPEHRKLETLHPAVRIRAELDPDLWNIQGSPVHLTKTVMNLVSNAAEAIPDGGDVVIRSSNRSVDGERRDHEATLSPGAYVRISVSDDGVGIPAEDREKIFEPFYTNKFMGRSGSGLGMAVVWGTVQDHQGSIDVRSTEGRGTTMALYFPRTLALPPAVENAASTADLRGHGETILVVDDVQEQRELAKAFLDELGYCAVTAASGDDAVFHVAGHPVDLVILDMIMEPGLDGLDTYRKILELRPGTRAVIASGYSETERARQAMALGAGRYILKPFTVTDLGRAVKTELARTPERR